MFAELILNRNIRACDICKLHAEKGPGFGNPNALLLLVAQNPGSSFPDWNKDHVPFGMQAWGERKLIDSSLILKETLEDVGIRREDLYITNAMKCLGKPERKYIENCSHWLEAELIELQHVKLVVALGRAAGDRLGVHDPYDLRYYKSQVEWGRHWIVGYVAHPAAPLYPGGISREEYVKQWVFIEGVLKRLEMEQTTSRRIP